MNKVVKTLTFFVDIDGTIVKYRKFSELSESTVTPIQDAIDFVNSYFDSGAIIIITTARPESYREFTENELNTLGVKYHQIVMDCGRGTRVVLNDIDPDKPELPRAVGLNLKRNGGLKDIVIPPYISSYESN